jgi:hypothetical protein
MKAVGGHQPLRAKVGFNGVFKVPAVKRRWNYFSSAGVWHLPSPVTFNLSQLGESYCAKLELASGAKQIKFDIPYGGVAKW